MRRSGRAKPDESGTREMDSNFLILWIVICGDSV